MELALVPSKSSNKGISKKKITKKLSRFLDMNSLELFTKGKFPKVMHVKDEEDDEAGLSEKSNSTSDSHTQKSSEFKISTHQRETQLPPIIDRFGHGIVRSPFPTTRLANPLVPPNYHNQLVNDHPMYGNPFQEFPRSERSETEWNHPINPVYHNSSSPLRPYLPSYFENVGFEKPYDARHYPSHRYPRYQSSEYDARYLPLQYGVHPYSYDTYWTQHQSARYNQQATQNESPISNSYTPVSSDYYTPNASEYFDTPISRNEFAYENYLIPRQPHYYWFDSPSRQIASDNTQKNYLPPLHQQFPVNVDFQYPTELYHLLLVNILTNYH
ncbi:hypothetical protein HK096_007547 [Nowakowskiella sp. JEL0078]|nr:hypothetical protein HK096_007547 [Nowakowskiella sp. JEL0078]